MSKAQHINPSIIRDFIVETFLFGDDSGLNDETSFMETGVIDSLGILKVADFIEHRFNIRLSQEQFVPENLDSIDNIVAFLNRNIAPTSIKPVKALDS
jgi:acyl carrier protein